MSDREANAELTWPQNCAQVHAQLDSAASCSICNDFYDTPLLLPCGHSFCSNCIRSYVSHQQGQAKCPQCRAACDERDLRPNTALRDLVDKLLQARPAYIAALRNQKAGPSRLVKAVQPGADSAPDSSSNKRQTRSSRTASAPSPVSAAVVEAADLQIQESPRKRQRLSISSNPTATSSTVPGPAKSKPVAPSSADVACCPICNRTFKAGRVLEAHVNRCIDNPPPPALHDNQQQQPKQHQHQQEQSQPAHRLQQKRPVKGVPQVKVPAKIAFHLFNDKKLRDKLKDVSLPTTGKRKDLEDRYNRLRLEVQLADDKGEAASESELVRRAMAKEKAALPVKGFFGVKGSGGLEAASDDPDLPEVEFDSFAALIQATKQRDAARKAKQQQARLAPASSGVSPEAEQAAERAALPQATDQTSDTEAAPVAEAQQGRGQLTERQAVNRPDPDRQQSAYPSDVSQLAAERQVHPVPPTTRLPSNTVVAQCSERSLPADSTSCIQHNGAGHLQTMKDDEPAHSQPSEPAEAHYRVDLTLDTTPKKLSQESLDVDVEDDTGQLPSHRVQDERALQQLHLLNKSAEPVKTNAACYEKSTQSLQEKDPVVSHVLYQQPLANNVGRTETGLGALNDIIEDTDSDVEGMLQ